MDKLDLDKKGFDTRAVYYDPEPYSQAINAPIYMATNYRYTRENYVRICEGEREAVNIYGRDGDPTDVKFAAHLARLEGTEAALAVASGMAAISTMFLYLLSKGDHVVSDWTTYRATHELYLKILPRFGVQVSFVDTTKPEQVAEAIRPETKLIYYESISNPNIKVAAIPPLVKIAREHGVLLAVDNTFASPYILRPAEWGVDLVVESATKFIGGHNNAFGGAICGKLDLIREMRDWSRLQLGGIISPFNAWLLLNGLQTLPVRVERSSQSAMILAQWLDRHPKVRKVHYPGLPTHPQHAIACEQMPKFGAVLTFELDDRRAAEEFNLNLELCSFAASLGGPRTTLQVPAFMAFLDAGPEERAKMSVVDGMVRVCVGLEDVADIIADFDQALQKV